MITIYSEGHHQHHGTEFMNGERIPSFESPDRAETILARTKEVRLGEVMPPNRYPTSAYERVHTGAYLAFLEDAWSEWTAAGNSLAAMPTVWPVRHLRSDVAPKTIVGKLGLYSMDTNVSLTAGTWPAVRASADCALTAMEIVAAGAHSAFALCRPPGHHAASDYMGGYCYLNNAAIAAQGFLDKGARRVAILDVDYHHGNGTQSIFYGRSDVLFVSLHGDPQDTFPYFAGHADERGISEGEGYNLNLPLPANTDWQVYSPALEAACRRIREFGADAVVVSLGVDTFKDDPISKFKLTHGDFLSMGAAIARIGRPTLFAMEGGYMVGDIGVNAVNVLTRFEECTHGD